MDEIDPEGREPVYLQVAAVVRRRIESGALQPNRPIPSEKQLEQELGVSRNTARHAVRVLREEGLVETVMGRGTFVLPPEDRAPDEPSGE